MLISLPQSPPIYLFSGYTYADVFFFCFFFSPILHVLYGMILQELRVVETKRDNDRKERVRILCKGTAEEVEKRAVNVHLCALWLGMSQQVVQAWLAGVREDDKGNKREEEDQRQITNLCLWYEECAQLGDVEWGEERHKQWDNKKTISYEYNRKNEDDRQGGRTIRACPPTRSEQSTVRPASTP